MSIAEAQQILLRVLHESLEDCEIQVRALQCAIQNAKRSENDLAAHLANSELVYAIWFDGVNLHRHMIKGVQTTDMLSMSAVAVLTEDDARRWAILLNTAPQQPADGTPRLRLAAQDGVRVS